VLSTDVFCLASPDFGGPLNETAAHPRRALGSVVAGVRDYGNRMGVPTAGGGVWFDDAYRQDPQVFCGSVGLMPAWAARKEVKPGDLIVLAGARTGRASAAPTGQAIKEKVLLDALLIARDRKLYHGLTNCGAGGLAAAVARLAGSRGAQVNLEQAPLKQSDLQPCETWLSESQERMIFAVPTRSLKAFQEVFAAEGCETAVLGEFTGSGRLEVSHGKQPVASLDLKFLRAGTPRAEKSAVWESKAAPKPAAPTHKKSLAQILAECLADLNVCSREWIVRQYDHEVQGGTVIKPLHGIRHDGPGDACVIWPRAAMNEESNFMGFAVSHGLNPAYGKLDAYRMAVNCADEALRNLLCVGADISRASFVANFGWDGPEDPARLGALVRAAEGCRDAALGYGVPFLSGQDSLGGRPTACAGQPGTLLISALAPLADVRKAVTMDIKGPGNALYLAGWTAEELGGSLFHSVCGRCASCTVPAADPKAALSTFRAVQAALAKGLVLSAHDLSEGGLGVCAAEMCFTGEFGAILNLDEVPRKVHIYSDEMLLFSESPSRLLLEVSPEREAAFLKAARGAAIRRVGVTVANPVLKVTGLDSRVVLETPLCDLKSAWQRSLSGKLE
jgi:phosphoribosylformylglycinamidine synthase